MTVLGIETSTNVCGAAISRDGRVVAERWRDEQYIHAEKLLPLIDAAMQAAQLTVHHLDGIAVSIGPGSFTGLRIGVSVAKGLAFALSRPIIGVPTLYAIARRAADAGIVQTGLLVPMLDARREEVYCQLFRVGKFGLDAVSDERAVHLSRLMEELAGDAATITGEGAARFDEYAGTVASHARQHVVIRDPSVSGCSAATVARLAEEMLRAGKKDDASSIEPRYIKEVYVKLPSHIRT